MSDECDQYAVKINNLQSSLKFFSFQGMTQDQIIDKYEETLCQREKQIRDIAYEIGIINEKLCSRDEKIKSLEEENQNVHNKILKKNTILEQELTNKDIMFIKLNNLQNENDRLMNILRENGISLASSNGKERKSFFSGIVDKFTNNNKKSQDNNKNIQLNSAAFKKDENKSTIKSNINISNSISSTMTPDLLKNIDLSLANISGKKEDNNKNEKSKSNNNNSQLNTNTNISNSNSNSNGNGNGKSSSKTALGRLSMPSSRLSTENLEYEPVFK